MPSAEPRRPEPRDHDPFYATYVDQVGDGDVLDVLAEGVGRTAELLRGLDAEAETFRYADGKWSIREVVGHVLDAERVFGFRALHMARADPAPLPGMDQDVWVRDAGAHHRPLASLLDELDLVRRGHLLMLRAFDDAAWQRRGTASGCDFTVRAFPYILAGHEIHHRRVLAQRYLAALA